MRRRALLALGTLAAVLLSGAPRAAGQTPSECRPGCRTAKATCLAEVTAELHTALQACASSASRRRCKRDAKTAAKGARHACRDFARGCRACCTSGGSDCSVGCGDGVVTAERGEQCDPPGVACGVGAVCDAQCHCPGATTTTVAVTTTLPPTTTLTSITSTTTSASTTTTTEPTGCALPGTGQIMCWNSSGTMISCTGTGQDGDIQAGLPLSFTDNGDGTITDDNTGLVWEKLGRDASVHDVGNTYTWDQAFSGHVATLNTMNFAGHNDWRLPNVKELESIVDYHYTDPAVTGTFFNCTAGCSPTTCSCTNSSGAPYWSSTTTAAFPDSAETVDFFAGQRSGLTKTSPAVVRAVRGDSPCLPATGQTTCWNSSGTVIPCAATRQDGDLRTGAPLSYTDNGDGTVTDGITGLVWEKLSMDGSEHDRSKTSTWDQAFAGHVAALNTMSFAGHNDWRVPNVKELQSIVDYQPSTLAVAPAFNTGCTSVGCTVLTCSCTQPNGFYWSSTTYSGPMAWVVLFDSGATSPPTKSVAEPVRAVRGGS